MSDRPITLILIAVAILLALYVRRTRVGIVQQIQTFDRGTIIAGTPELLSEAQAKKEAKARGVEWNVAGPVTRDLFEKALGK